MWGGGIIHHAAHQIADRLLQAGQTGWVFAGNFAHLPFQCADLLVRCQGAIGGGFDVRTHGRFGLSGIGTRFRVTDHAIGYTALTVTPVGEAAKQARDVID